jgi:hypothetical protein
VIGQGARVFKSISGQPRRDAAPSMPIER